MEVMANSLIQIDGSVPLKLLEISVWYVMYFRIDFSQTNFIVIYKLLMRISFAGLFPSSIIIFPLGSPLTLGQYWPSPLTSSIQGSTLTISANPLKDFYVGPNLGT